MFARGKVDQLVNLSTFAKDIMLLMHSSVV